MDIYIIFLGAPVNFLAEDLSPTDVPSIIDVLCQLFEGLAIETKIIRKQYLGSMVEELLAKDVSVLLAFFRKVEILKLFYLYCISIHDVWKYELFMFIFKNLKGSADHNTGLLDTANLEHNL